MWPVTYYLSFRAFYADALFVLALQRSDEPDAGQVRRVIEAALRAFGSRGCAEKVAQEFGDHPETAVRRMRGARRAVREAFADSDSGLGPALNAPPASELHAVPAHCRSGART
jgi:hypothetical protein